VKVGSLAPRQLLPKCTKQASKQRSAPLAIPQNMLCPFGLLGHGSWVDGIAGTGGSVPSPDPAPDRPELYLKSLVSIVSAARLRRDPCFHASELHVYFASLMSDQSLARSGREHPMLVPSASGMNACLLRMVARTPQPAALLSVRALFLYRQWPRFAVDVTSAAPVRPHTD